MKQKTIEKKIAEQRLMVIDEALTAVKDKDDRVRLLEIYDREMSALIKRFPESKLSPLTKAEKRRAADLRRTDADLRHYRRQKREAEDVLAECNLDKYEKAIFNYRLKEADEKIGPLNKKAKRLRKLAQKTA